MLSLQEKIGQMLVVGFDGLAPPDHILDWLRQGRIGGVILFARNVDTPAQVADLTEKLHRAARRPILVAIDQEGGAVARLREGFTESPGAMALGAADSPMLAERVSGVLAAEMRALGINWNLAPAIDLTHNIHNPSVGVRSLGADPAKVSRLAEAQVRGYQGEGVAATAKHFPGKANTTVDPHVELPVIDGPLEDMWDTDLAPFRAASAAGVAATMVTHVQFKAIEPEYPSTLSPAIIQGLLRDRVGFRGVVTTDCMEMNAVTLKHGAGESAVLAARAGANILFFSHTSERQEEAYRALLEAARSGRLPMERVDESVEKIAEMKDKYAVTRRTAPETIRSPGHLAVMEEAARAGTVLHLNAAGAIPLDSTARTALIEYASHIEMESLSPGATTAFAAKVKSMFKGLESVWLDPANPSDERLAVAERLAETCDTVIVATRNAHLSHRQRETAQTFIDSASNPVLVCLRNPYDAGVLLADTVLLTLGDSAPSLTAAADALAGGYKPQAGLPVPLTMS
ncbi:beta-N-acetylhexosaminidase [Candidatus Bathyarchaeota archaeon]|nr:beta-N-acetylhexosaminidase [Candidatus Bathyarchaeota archaeon]